MLLSRTTSSPELGVVTTKWLLLSSVVWLLSQDIVTTSVASSVSEIVSNDTCPSACFCDEVGRYVSCVGDGLWQMPSDLPRTAVRLELRNFILPFLSIGDLLGLFELQELKIQQAQIAAVEGGSFVHLIKLTRLDLSQNVIENLTSEVFDGLQSLRYLDLSSNALINAEEAFHVLVNVEQLNLRANKLAALTGGSFVGLQRVQYLNLDYNSIATIEVGAFQHLKNLAHLILSNNPLKTLARLDFFGSRLQYIDVSNISLERVPQSLTRYVRDLRMTKNNLTRVSAGDFDSYPYLGLLVLDDNSITEIENDALGRLEDLLRLWLNGNRLTRVPVNLPLSLRVLYMQENQLHSLHPYSFRGLVNLEQLFLQRNRISNISACAFCDLRSLTSLDLQANQIEVLMEGVFANLTFLDMLDLSQNNIKVIGYRSFVGMENLHILRLSRLSPEVDFDENIFDPLQVLQSLELYDSSLLTQSILSSARVLHGLRHLQQLNIIHNRLTNIRSDFPSFFPLLKVIKLSDNSWYCSQNITWLTNWIKMSNVQFYRSYSVRCTMPKRLHNKPIMLLSEDDFAEGLVSEITTKVAPTAKADAGQNISTTLAILDFIAGGLTNEMRTSTSTTITTTNTIVDVTYKLSDPQETSTEKLAEEMKSTQKETIEDGADNKSTQASLITTSQAISSLSNSTESPTMDTTSKTTKTILDETTPYYLDSSSVADVMVTEYSLLSSAYSTTASLFKKVSPDSFNLNGTQSKPKSLGSHIQSQRINRTDQILKQLYINAMGRGPAMPTEVANHNGQGGESAPYWNQLTALTVSTSLAGGCLVVMTATVVLFTVYRCRRRCARSAKVGDLRRSSSISYHPQRDEISIMTVSEGTVGWKTSTHHGLGNKLYYALENVDLANEPCTVPFLANQL